MFYKLWMGNIFHFINSFTAIAEITEQSEQASAQQDAIDNPYLRPGKVPDGKASSMSLPDFRHSSKKDILGD